MRRRPLLPPATPPGLPHGLTRGGVLDAPWVSGTYIDAARPTVVTNSPLTHDVSEDVFRSPISFTSSETVRTVTRGFGQMIERADLPPIAVPRYRPVRVPHGMTEGGIFGRGHYIDGRALPAVPQRYPQLQRDTRVVGYGMSPDGLGWR